ncbi:MAG: cysteine desulfurase, partial [Candidatus Uhrbacteria bacterium]|nr:cysteine desulfurase [Candidatus Uhrbacteria bacterium]
MKRMTYLDYAAATPLDRRVLRAMLPYLKEEFGNPSSIHAAGVRSRQAIESARASVAGVIGARQEEVVFTSGATESINLAIQGLLARHPGHIVTLATEHQAALSALHADVTYVDVDEFGVVKAEDVLRAIRPDTVLVTIMLANNEIGVINPVAAIGRELEKLRKQSGSAFPLLHTDATQAANYLDLNVTRLHVDMMSLSGSKIYGPKGAGMLFVRRGVELAPLLVGGRQENRLRAGTENVAGIVGFAEALRLAQETRG